MSNKKTFVSNGKEITIGKGNLDLFKSSEEFRNKVQLFCDGINKMNDIVLQARKTVNAMQTVLEVYQKGTYVDGTEVEKKEAEIVAYKEAIAKVENDIRTAMPSFNETDDNLFLAYRQFINDEITEKTYARAFAEWLDNGGIAPTDKGISFLMGKIGIKKASAKQSCISGGTKFVDAMGKKQYLDLVYRIIGEMMYKANALKPYEYAFKVEVKGKATKNA